MEPLNSESELGPIILSQPDLPVMRIRVGWREAVYVTLRSFLNKKEGKKYLVGDTRLIAISNFLARTNDKVIGNSKVNE